MIVASVYLQSQIQTVKAVENAFNKKNNLTSHYPKTLVNIISLNFFKKNLELFKNKIKYNNKLPFNFERKFDETKNLNFKNTVLNEEFFVSIDDDHNSKNSSLISRGLYLNRTSRNKMLIFRALKYNFFQQDNLFRRIKNKFPYSNNIIF